MALGTTKGMHCVRFKQTSAGKRCAKYAGGRRGRGRGRGRRHLGTTEGMHCIRYKKTRAGRRCAKYAD